MERLKLSKHIGKEMDLDIESKKPHGIDGLIKWLETKKAEGANAVTFRGFDIWDDEPELLEIQAIQQYDEPDDMMKERLAFEKVENEHMQKIKKEREIREYQRLQMIYGDLK